MTFEQQIQDIVQSVAQELSGRIEERLRGLATEVSQAAASDRVSVVRELRLAAEAEVAKRSQEAVAAAQDEHARRLDEAVSAVRLEGARRLDDALGAARSDHTRRIDEAVAAVRVEMERERDAAVGAVRAEVSREHDASIAAALAAARAEEDTRLAHAVEAARVAARADESRVLADSLARSRVEAAARLAQAVEAARSDASAAARRALVDVHVSERQSELAQVDRLADAIRRIDGARSLTDVLDALAESASREAPRVAVFVVRGGHLAGWRHSGFPPDVDPTRMELSVEQPGLLTRALRGGSAVTTSDGPSSDPTLVTPFGALPTSSAALAVPVRIGGETVAIVYADDAVSGHEVPSAFPEVIEVLACHAARCLEVLTFSRAAAQAGAARAVRPAQAAASVPDVPAAPLSARVPDSPPSPRYAPQTRSFQSTGNEDEDAARRYARLLVSEIKLYHEPAVSEGRRNRNLIERLRTEIDRAQRLYEERVPVQIRLKADFFGQELVRTLAGGDPALLGSR